VISLPAHHHTVFKTTATHMETQICSDLTTCTLHTTTLSSKQLPLTWKHKFAVILLPAHHYTVFQKIATHMEKQICSDLTTCTPPHCLPLTWKHKIAVILLPAHHHTVFKTTATHMETQNCCDLTTCTPPHCLQNNCHSHGNVKLQ